MASEKQPTTLTFEGWKYSHYFELVETKGRNISVRCTLCPGEKLLSAAANSNANLTKHLNGKHASMKLVAQDPRGKDGPSPNKQQKLQFHQVSKKELDKHVASFIVEEMLPINTVESPTFRKILSKIPLTGDRRPCSDRKTFTAYLDECYLKMESELKKTFESLPYVSTTADIWSSHNRSFLGITVHWINPRNFKREKAAIACKRIKGRHTFDVIGFEMEQIHSAFSLSHRITATVTDNGSNFVKAFKMFAPTEPNEEEEDEQDVVFTDMEELLGVGTTEGQFSLPPHFRCASHTLNLISCNDIDKWLSSNSDSKCVYRSATAKCAALWTKASRSTVASEIVDEICGKKMIVPTSTRWNSFHDALSRISDNSAHDLNTLCARLDIRAPTEREHLFLKEYCSVLKPLTVALDILQGEDNCYYGVLLPTLETLMSRTLALSDGLSRMTANLPGVIVQAIKTRFAPVLESREALLAALTLPKFKVRWIGAAERREAARALLIAECRTLPHEEPAENKQREVATHSSASEADFFSFDEEEDATSFSADAEVLEYLRSGSELDVLNRFPRVRAVFMKYNTATPSSAPVERLFSLGGIVLTPRRNRLSDKRFERLLLMRYNHTFCADVE
ncbi:putative AC9 transposase [Merluccius polli]|uniref:AC9 transposase n=1 Tax=Merluccius polli TaxID=89951 RepID=A0AA47P222_MERPO|nr:putative AC9 transposase [Merluccius polli]